MLMFVISACGATRQLLTAPPTEAGSECPLRGTGGQLVEDERWGLAIRGADGNVSAVLWPNGSRIGLDGTRVALIGPDGVVLAHVGDEVEMAGGYNRDGLFVPCPGRIAVVPS